MKVPDWMTITVEEAADAALLNNVVIKSFLLNPLPSLKDTFTEASIRSNPPVVMRWEHGRTVCRFLDAATLLVSGRPRGAGAFLGVGPVERDDPFHFFRASFVPAATHPSEVNRRRLGPISDALGRRYAKLVRLARTRTKRKFVAGLTQPEVSAIKSRIGVDPGAFWKLAKGHAEWTPPAAPAGLFDDLPENGDGSAVEEASAVS